MLKKIFVDQSELLDCSKKSKIIKMDYTYFYILHRCTMNRNCRKFKLRERKKNITNNITTLKFRIIFGSEKENESEKNRDQYVN